MIFCNRYTIAEYLALSGEWESGSTVTGKFLNMLEKDGEDQLDSVRK
jgi:hypothetical protein